MYFSVDGMDYWYEVHGEGIPMVLLHGFTGSSLTWTNLIETRPPGFQFITVDLPGHGRTTGDVIKTMDECVNDLQHLFQSLGLKRFFLLGYSMGGRTALSFAVKFPESLQGLILVGASPGIADLPEREARISSDEELILLIEQKGVQAFVDYWQSIPMFESQKHLPLDVQRTIRSGRLSQSGIGLANSLRGMGTGSQSSNWGALEHLSFPVLLLVGELDKKYVIINQKMEKKIPHAQLKVFPNAGHAVHIEKPASFAQTVQVFAKSHTS